MDFSSCYIIKNRLKYIDVMILMRRVLLIIGKR